MNKLKIQKASEIHVLRIKANINQIQLFVKFPSAVSFSLQCQKVLQTTKDSTNLINGVAYPKTMLTFQVEVQKTQNGFKQKKVYLNVNLITKSGSIGVGRVNMQISGHEFGKMRKVEERIEKCPDKNARISMGVTVEFIKKYTKAHEDVAQKQYYIDDYYPSTKNRKLHHVKSNNNLLKENSSLSYNHHGNFNKFSYSSVNYNQENKPVPNNSQRDSRIDRKSVLQKHKSTQCLLRARTQINNQGNKEVVKMLQKLKAQRNSNLSLQKKQKILQGENRALRRQLEERSMKDWNIYIGGNCRFEQLKTNNEEHSTNAQNGISEQSSKIQLKSSIREQEKKTQILKEKYEQQYQLLMGKYRKGEEQMQQFLLKYNSKIQEHNSRQLQYRQLIRQKQSIIVQHKQMCEKVKKQLNYIKGQYNFKQQQMAQLMERQANSNKKMQQYDNSLSKLEQELSNVKFRLQQQIRINEKLSQENEQMRSVNLSLSHQIMNTKDHISLQRMQSEQMQLKNLQINQQLHDYMYDIKQLQQSVTFLKKQLSNKQEVINETQTHEEQIIRLSKQIEQFEALIKQIQDKYEEQIQQYIHNQEVMENQLTNTNHTVSKYQQIYEETSADLNNANREISQLSRKIIQMEQQHNELQNKYKQLELEISVLNSKNKMLHKKDEQVMDLIKSTQLKQMDIGSCEKALVKKIQSTITKITQLFNLQHLKSGEEYQKLISIRRDNIEFKVRVQKYKQIINKFKIIQQKQQGPSDKQLYDELSWLLKENHRVNEELSFLRNQLINIVMNSNPQYEIQFLNKSTIKHQVVNSLKQLSFSIQQNIQNI